MAYAVEQDLAKHGFSVDFAIRYFHSVVIEFDVEIEFRRNLEVPAVRPVQTYSHSRYGDRIPLTEQSWRF